MFFPATFGNTKFSRPAALLISDAYRQQCILAPSTHAWGTRLTKRLAAVGKPRVGSALLSTDLPSRPADQASSLAYSAVVGCHPGDTTGVDGRVRSWTNIWRRPQSNPRTRRVSRSVKNAPHGLFKPSLRDLVTIHCVQDNVGRCLIHSVR